MDKKISQLSSATTPLTGAEELAIVQSGVTKKTTIEDIKGYKVYTALLTQSGGDNQLNIFSGSLTIGVTYRIVHDGPTAGDFTNVGAPNNDDDTMFVATGTTPNSWGDYFLSYNTGAPVVTVLENTIGNIWFTYNNVGNYIANLPIGEASKTLCLATSNDSAQNYSVGFFVIGSYTNGIVNIANFDPSGNALDGWFQSIEIRVYN